MAQKIRSEANGLALEVNARQGNDDPVRMGDIHMMALKMKIGQALKNAPSRKKDLQSVGRISKTSPMTALADRAKAYDTHVIKKRAIKRDDAREAKVAQAQSYRKKRGKLKNDILSEVKRASYMTQFNGLGYYGALGHYHGGMGFSLKKAFKSVAKAASKVAAPIQKVAAVVSKPVVQAAKYTAKSAVRAANIVKKDPIGALAKVTVAAPFTIIASVAPKNTVVGKLARKAEAGTVKVVKAVADVIGKALEMLKNLIAKALKPIIDFFKKAFDGIKNVIIDKVAARFTGKGVNGFGSLPEDEKKKLTELTTGFMSKKALEAAGIQTTILGTATAAATTTATAAVTTAAAAAGPAAPAAAAAAAPAAATTAATAATPAATYATTAYVTKLTGEGVQDISTEFAKYKAQKAIPNPALRAMVNAGIDGKLPTDKESIMKAASNLPAQAQAELVKKVQSAPEAMKQEILKKALVPQEFQKAVDFLPKEANALAAGKPAIPQIAIAEAMQKAYKADPKIKDITPEQAKEQAALGVAVQDEMAIEMVKEGKMTMTEGLVASSKIGKEQAIKQLPPEVRPQAVAALKKEMSNVEVARIDQKVADDKAKSSGAILTAAAIAAKVLLF
jgi:hypothetical protein